ncbi:DivIVA domain-containing protein [Saccharothrix coeruleofusca]|uniref:DivIVA protein n=1 Tax=Saccharothrix coeruleofusca TaxID=33919 RepID=A0A918AVT4_9PSEU|nr:hypothetical protein [Saccharothrix coeruleofusca]MBP2335421.1 cell division septum initiation protein DivIVA [Saccharothrix coeruleofusca]GGP77700.1 hypothetical protein GCM10010185_59370 [Saccharothrix coeruleofusca]
MGIDEFLSYSDMSFRLQWRGYHKREVDEELARLVQELEVLRTDRDAAVAMVDDLTRQLEATRSELGEYRVLHAGYSRENTVSGCIRYLMHVAKQKAEAVETSARRRSEEMLRQAEEVAARQAVLLDETEQETQRRLAEATRRAQEIVQAAVVESRSLVADLVQRQELLDRWCAEIETPLDVPAPRESVISGPMRRLTALGEAASGHHRMGVVGETT